MSKSLLESSFSSQQYLIHYMLLPDTILVSLLTVLECIMRKMGRYADHALFAVANIMGMVITLFIHLSVTAAPLIMILPLLVSTLMLNRRYLLLSALIGIVFSSTLIMLQKESFAMTGLIIINGSILLCTAISGFGVILRGQELIDSLEKSTNSEKDLLIRNALMDRTTKIDPLTNLYNHKTYHEYMEKLLVHSGDNPYHLQLAVIDIDNFKSVNDTYGHATGDIALKSVAQRIQEHIGPDDFAARYGGEEFVIILTGGDSDKAFEHVEKIRESVAATAIPELDGRMITISIGLHECLPGETKEQAFQMADNGLYAAKKSGKNRTVVQ
ncbi:GGDEF domain-containing protein [Paenibacillus tarimensis]|uniref:GGDEF domain-containing protein n=1 Tax=Paenibacillus tarimensis TaxID=416012 RepID=UPI001F336869|nr:GGDEF domain-containing protein [Paenibacillus tarimensis]